MEMAVIWGISAKYSQSGVYHEVGVDRCALVADKRANR